MGRNLILCFDGTNNQYAATNTNVVKIYAMLDREANDQFSYYLTDANQKKVKTRVDDGIHFTPTGQRLIAERVISMINFPSPQITEH